MIVLSFSSCHLRRIFKISIFYRMKYKRGLAKIRSTSDEAYSMLQTVIFLP